MTLKRSGSRKSVLGASFSDAFIFMVAGGPRAPSEARRQLDEQLEGRIPVAVAEIARLLVSELVTNCVQHGGATTRHSIEVSGSLLKRTLWLEVASDGPAFRHAPARPDDMSAGGRGLYLVDSLSEAWGIATESGRAAVWLELARD